MSNLKEKTLQAVEALMDFIDSSPWKNKYGNELSKIRAKIDEPCVVAVAGRVKAGKSSFINAFLGGDFAKVGTTETTATINYFRYGKPADPEKPIRCVWENDRITWESKEFLNSLQGNTQEVLEKSAGIKQLEFFIDNPRLEFIRLVDTPGTGAIVGQDGGEHEKVTSSFFNLRKKHNEETLQISRDADAVIYLTGEVGQSRDVSFLTDFQNEGCEIHSFNTLAIMSKVDLLNDDEIERKNEYAQSIQEALSAKLPMPLRVIPISAGIQRFLSLNTRQQLQNLQSKLRGGFDNEVKFNMAMANEVLYKMNSLPGCTLSKSDRDSFLGETPWRVFGVVARALFQKELDEAIRYLKDLAGFDAVNRILEEQFFQRSIILRCVSVIQECCKLLSELLRSGLYQQKELHKNLTRDVNRYIDFMSEAVRLFKKYEGRDETELSNGFRMFCLRYLPKEKVVELQHKLEAFIARFENLLQLVERENRDFEGLQKLEEAGDVFSAEEKSELQVLFGLIPGQRENWNIQDCIKRQSYWRYIGMNSRSEEKKAMSGLVELQYGILINKLK